MREVYKWLNFKCHWVVDADLKSYFDTIPHDKLLLSARSRVIDRSVVKLIELWLKAGVMEDIAVRKELTGTPQGGVISPLLSDRSDKSGYGNLMVMGTQAAGVVDLQRIGHGTGSHKNWRVQVAASIASNSSCRPLNMPLPRLGGRHLSSVSSLSVGSACRCLSVV